MGVKILASDRGLRLGRADPIPSNSVTRVRLTTFLVHARITNLPSCFMGRAARASRTWHMCELVHQDYLWTRLLQRLKGGGARYAMKGTAVHTLQVRPKERYQLLFPPTLNSLYAFFIELQNSTNDVAEQRHATVAVRMDSLMSESEWPRRAFDDPPSMVRCVSRR